MNSSDVAIVEKPHKEIIKIKDSSQKSVISIKSSSKKLAPSRESMISSEEVTVIQPTINKSASTAQSGQTNKISAISANITSSTNSGQKKNMPALKKRGADGTAAQRKQKHKQSESVVVKPPSKRQKRCSTSGYMNSHVSK